MSSSFRILLSLIAVIFFGFIAIIITCLLTATSFAEFAGEIRSPEIISAILLILKTSMSVVLLATTYQDLTENHYHQAGAHWHVNAYPHPAAMTHRERQTGCHSVHAGYCVRPFQVSRDNDVSWPHARSESPGKHQRAQCRLNVLMFHGCGDSCNR